MRLRVVRSGGSALQDLGCGLGVTGCRLKVSGVSALFRVAGSVRVSQLWVSDGDNWRCYMDYRIGCLFTYTHQDRMILQIGCRLSPLSVGILAAYGVSGS